jgi:hypothetical protein
MATNDEIIGNKLGGILCQSDAHNDVSPDGQGYYISDGTVLVRYVSDVPKIREMLDTARADTAKQILRPDWSILSREDILDRIEYLKHVYEVD